jgi:hypothetical protein
MVRWIIAGVVLSLSVGIGTNVNAVGRYDPDAIPICSLIITEMTEGKIGLKKAKEISNVIAEAGNRHFGRVTCGDMWLFMAIVYIESGFKSGVVNQQNCRGMFQVHAPSWARKFGVRYNDLYDPEINADVGIAIFKYYLALYRNLVSALSAYNSDHPRAAVGYARSVLNIRQKIKKRYAQLYSSLRDNDAKMVGYTQNLNK